MSNGFVENIQQQVREQAEYDTCNADGMKGVEFRHEERC
jgi:hypothetical protein